MLGKIHSRCWSSILIKARALLNPNVILWNKHDFCYKAKISILIRRIEMLKNENGYRNAH
jgi:hypothetical protein